MWVSVDVSQEELDGDYANYVDGLRLTCTRCGHSVTVYGTGEASAKRGAYMLREECPSGESNFYDVSSWTG